MIISIKNTISASSNPASTWLPTDVNGLTIWHRNGTDNLDDGETAVEQWHDSSGNDNHAIQETGGNQAQAYKGGLDFDGTDDYYEYDVDMNIATGDAYTLAIVYELDDNSVKSCIFSKDHNLTFIEFFDADTIRINYDGNDLTMSGGTHTAGSARILVVTRDSNGDHRLYEAGSDTSITTGNQDGVAIWQNIGIRNDASRAFNGKIYEVMVWDARNLKNTDLTNLNTYLTNVLDSLP